MKKGDISLSATTSATATHFGDEYRPSLAFCRTAAACIYLTPEEKRFVVYDDERAANIMRKSIEKQNLVVSRDRQRPREFIRL